MNSESQEPQDQPKEQVPQPSQDVEMSEADQAAIQAALNEEIKD